MGIIVGSWFHVGTVRPPHGDDQSRLNTIARHLRAATGLQIEETPAGALRFPMLHEELFDWVFGEDAVTVHSFLPAHPYLWENLDAVMTAMGGVRDTETPLWRPNPAHEWLRTRWQALSRRDRRVLSIPSVLAARPFDRLLSSGVRAPARP